MKKSLRVLVGFALLAVCSSAFAHKASTSYLRLRVDGAQLGGRWDIALRDLDYAIGLDADGDGKLTWGEVLAAQALIADHALSHLRIADDHAACAVGVEGLKIVDHSDGAYAVLALTGRCARVPRTLRIDYDLLFDLDALHRGLLNLDYAGTRSAVFTPDQRSLRFDASTPGFGQQFKDYFLAGVWHVWSGLDHMLFLAGLFLPAVLRRVDGQWQAAPHLREVLRDTTLMVTAFTVAHACTLSLAASGSFAPPPRLVESAVAATVLFAGLNNLLPMVYRELFVLAGVFGLIHGAAIAGALTDLGLPAQGRVWALLAFNLGVEAAQLSVLLAVIPPSFRWRRSDHYRRLALMPGSVLVSAAGLAWLIERGLQIDLGIPTP